MFCYQRDLLQVPILLKVTVVGIQSKTCENIAKLNEYNLRLDTILDILFGISVLSRGILREEKACNKG